ncbi:MAG: lipoyl synthase [Gemmatimonadota bacterium]|nr:lipoyl synthase [Gemmatimonadota bacterium]MDP6460961.1 lipoyl synthase [Gemmatimonadota bacterium]MDP6529698.1 lipoyl synthase [Gemmatimonadota bacterium]MDP6802485.1 lipoyl synthase [Gemmatimonadota bacterium]MDP7030958.1 lipoyl synthase [Gemmatimonadota bacterium]
MRGRRRDEPRRPEWLKVRMATGREFRDVRKLVDGLHLHTVCQEARCPNIYECWEDRTATFMVLGDICTRYCSFCAVGKGDPQRPDAEEPGNVAAAVAHLELAHAVITSVNRDDLPDGGAAHFAETIRLIRQRNPECRTEVLIPDFDGNQNALDIVLDANPDILNHNLETVERLYRRVRPRAIYRRSLDLLARAGQHRESGLLTKSGMMVGLGETTGELLHALADLRSSGVDIVTIGQYLSPSPEHLGVEKYYTPAEFDEIREEAEDLGFRFVESGPLVRSSYHARRHADGAASRPGEA